MRSERAAAHRGDLTVGRHALEAGDDRDLARGERLADAVALDLDDLGPVVLGVGDDAGLRPGERHRGHAERLDRHRQQRHRDALARGEQHVELAAAGLLGDVVGEPHQVVGGLAHGRHDDDDVVAGAAGAGDVVGHGTDPVGVGHRGAAEFLDEKHGNQGYRCASPAHEGFRDRGPVHSAPMPSADKRARQKENARAAREQREAALKRKKRNRSIMTFGIIAALFVGLILILSVTGSDKKDKKSSSTTSTTPPTAAKPVADYKLDAGKTYTATIATNLGNIGVKLNTKDAPIAAGHFIKLAKAGVYDGSRWHRIIKDFVIQGGAPGGDPTKDYGKSGPGRAPEEVRARRPRRREDRSGPERHVRLAVLHRHRIAGRGAAVAVRRLRFRHVGHGRREEDRGVADRRRASGEPSSKATIDKITIKES